MHVLRGIAASLLIIFALGAGNPGAAQFSALPNLNSGDAEAYRTILTRLAATRMTVAFEEEGLHAVLRRVAREAAINLVVGVPLAGRAEEPVNLTLKDVTAKSLLALLAEGHGLAFQHRHGVLVATTPEDAQARSMVLRIYGVWDILYAPPDFPAPVELGLRPGPPEARIPEEPERKEGFGADLLVDLIRENTGGDKVWGVDGASLTIVGGRLFVRQGTAVQGQVQRLIDRLR